MSTGDWIALAALLLTLALLSNKNIRLLLNRVKLILAILSVPFVIAFICALILLFLGTVLLILFPYLPSWLTTPFTGFHTTFSSVPLWINIPAALLYACLIYDALETLSDRWYWNTHKQDIKEMYKRVLDEGEE